MKQKVKSTKLLVKNFGIVLVLLLSFWAIKPLFIPGFFPMHDDTQVARVFEMGKALRDGMFPVRWVPDLGYGYGYPIFNFYAPLAYYFGGFLTLLRFDALVSTKIMMVAGVLFSGVFMYLLAREFWGELGGILSGLFYVYAPYHALDIYIRGDVGEFWAYAFVPLMFLGIYKIFSISHIDYCHFGESRLNQDDSRISTSIRDSGQARMTKDIWKWVVVGSLGYTGVILSHNLTAMMVMPFLLIAILLNCYIVPKGKKLLIFYHSSLIILLGLLLSAFYWIPALFEMKYTNILSQIGGGADFRDHFVCMQQLWDSAWGFGGSTYGCIDGLSFKIGKLHIILVLIVLITTSIYYAFRHSGKPVSRRAHPESPCALRASADDRDSGQARMTSFEMNSRLPIIILSILGFIFSAFLTLEISKPIWEAISVMAFFQYPWRFLILASFFSSLLAGFCVWYLKAKFSDLKYFNTVPYLSGVALVFLLIFLNAKLFQPQTLVSKTANDYTNEIALKWTASKISDEYLPPDFNKPKSERDIARNPAIKPQETILQKVSNMISLIGTLSLIAGIILSRSRSALSK